MKNCVGNKIDKNSNIFALYDFNNYNYLKDKDSIGTVAVAGNDRLVIYPLYIKRIIRRMLREHFGLDTYFSRDNLKDGKSLYNTQELIDKYIDIRLFGMGTDSSKPILPIAGTANFGNGNNLNRLCFLNRTSIKRGLVGFDGAIRATSAKYSGMTDIDTEYLDQCIVNSSCNSLAGSRSMRLYIRVELEDHTIYLPSLLNMVCFQENYETAEKNEMDNVLDITRLVNCLNSFNGIETIHIFWDEILPLKYENVNVESAEGLAKLFNTRVSTIDGK